MTTKPITTKAIAPVANSDAYVWADPYGGSWGNDPYWTDTTTGLAAPAGPGASNAVTLIGASGSNNFSNIIDNGAASQVSVSNNIILWGTLAVGGAVTLMRPPNDFGPTSLQLDGGADLGAGSLVLGYGTSMQIGNGSTLTVSGAANLTAGSLLVTGGSIAQLGALIASAGAVIGVDDNSSLEVGLTGGAALGAVTIDNGQSAAVSGSMFGDLVVNGTLGVEAGGNLSVDVGDPLGTAQGISGKGILLLSEQSTLELGVADSVAIDFAGPSGTLVADVLPSGAIIGFAAGDVIDLNVSVTGLRFTQTSATVATLTLTKGAKTVGTLSLAGNYSGSRFHLSVTPYGASAITIQTVGGPPAQPGVITGTAGQDSLYATANNQTLTGLGGGDTLTGGTFTKVDFKDTSADFNGSTITAFGASDVIDLTDVKLSAASVTYVTPAPDLYGMPATPVLTVTDGTHTATMGLVFGGPMPTGYFALSSDGASGTDMTYVAVNTDTYSVASAVGGGFGVAADWQDTTTGAKAALAPSYGNNITIAGATGEFSSITGNGVAASLATSGDVLLWGTLNVGSKLAGVSGALTQTGTLALDGSAVVTLGGTASLGGMIEIEGGSKLTAAGGLLLASNGAALLVSGGGSAQFAGVSGVPGENVASLISVDASSSIEFGGTGGAATGALTIDAGVTADLAGSIYGNIVVNGTLAVGRNGLSLGSFGTTASSVSGAGMLLITNGATLSMAGADSAAIAFAALNGIPVTETLALGAALPTKAISGFANGDVISLAQVVTGSTYSQSGASGTLTLLNGTKTVGSLMFAGSYTASQFLLVPSGASTIITCAATPGMVAGGQASSNSDAYIWNSTSGGAWSNAGNWMDSTTGSTTTVAPGAGNAVTISNYTATAQIVSGSGSAASLMVTTSTVFTGNITVAGWLSGSTFSSTIVALENGAGMSAGGVSGGSLLVAGGSRLTVSGSAGNSVINGLSVIGGSSVKVVGLGDLGGQWGGVTMVDSASTLEAGSGGSAAKGTLTIDSGQTTQLDGTIDGQVVVNGTLIISQYNQGTIQGFGGTTGSVSGTGTIDLGNSLILNAADSAAIAFTGMGGPTLELRGPLPTGTISGFGGSDIIQVDRTVTGVSFSQTTASQGTLTLTNGAATVGTLTLAGNFQNSAFHVDVGAVSGAAMISVLSASGAVTGAGTVGSGSDAYAWSGNSGGSWGAVANWQDTTAAKPAAFAPGSGDAVTIAGQTNPGQYTTVVGNGAASSLAVSTNVMLTGQVSVAGGLSFLPLLGRPGSLVLDAGAKLTAGSAVVSGRLQVGGGSSATIAGVATLMNGALLAMAGSVVQVGGLVGSGAASVIAVDANSIMKIGASAGAAAGRLTQAAGATAALTGSIFGSVAANGTFAVAGGGALFIDMIGTAGGDPYAGAPTISGTGSLSLTEGSTLGLGVADSAAIKFAGPNATLVLAKLPTATITGFTTGDQIQIDQTVTGLSYHQGTGKGTLTLTNGAATVGTLQLAGSYGVSTVFHLAVAPNGNTAVITLQTLGVAATQPTLIQGTAAADLLTATANNQTITGLGGADTLGGGGFSGTDFKDLTANLNGSSVQNFALSDVLDFTDMKSGSASGSLHGNVLTVTDGTHSATLNMGFSQVPPNGHLAFSSDGGSGTKLSFS